MLIRDVLRRKGDFVATLPPTATVNELLATLAEHNIGAVVVCRPESAVEGIVSERDVARALQAHGAAVLDQPVAQIMTRDVRVAAPEETVEALMVVMTEARIRHVPVMSGQQLVGIVSIGDAVKIRMEQLESERQSLIGYVSGG